MVKKNQLLFKNAFQFLTQLLKMCTFWRRETSKTNDRVYKPNVSTTLIIVSPHKR